MSTKYKRDGLRDMRDCQCSVLPDHVACTTKNVQLIFDLINNYRNRDT